MVLMDDDPQGVAVAIQVARKTMHIVWQNIVFAIGVKVAIMLLAAVGIANMWLAVFGDVGVAVLAILNAMRCMNIARSKDLRRERKSTVCEQSAFGRAKLSRLRQHVE